MANEQEASIRRRDELVEQLKSRSRSKRQEASHGIAIMARANAAFMLEVADDLVMALELPEAQTRWECLDALSEIALIDAACTREAFDGAEEALFDEGSAAAHLSAFRFLARYGSVDPEASRRAWPLMREAIQCYHGDPEYREMLVCLLEFARGSISPEVGEGLIERMRFDAQSGTGFYRAYSKEICSTLQKA
ncbi:MAG: hypothetical protein IKF14_00745 [Atopobiaceae bacterium]|nr:hypothetical protein [Atopobiaceae bacterium]